MNYKKIIPYGILAGSIALAPNLVRANYVSPSKLNPAANYQNIESKVISDNLIAMNIESPANESSGVQAEVKPDYVGLRYSSNNFVEFLNGLAYPFTLWRKNPNLYTRQPDGTMANKTEILPCYTHPLREGGILSWANPYAWKNNALLTGGNLVTLAAIGGGITVALSSGKKKTEEKKDEPKKDEPTGSQPDPDKHDRDQP